MQNILSISFELKNLQKQLKVEKEKFRKEKDDYIQMREAINDYKIFLEVTKKLEKAFLFLLKERTAYLEAYYSSAYLNKLMADFKEYTESKK